MDPIEARATKFTVDDILATNWEVEPCQHKAANEVTIRVDPSAARFLAKCKDCDAEIFCRQDWKEFKLPHESLPDQIKIIADPRLKEGEYKMVMP